MTRLVEELQKDCVNPIYSYANLFQKAYFIAKKLEQNDMIEFLKNEIDGYGHKKVPSYRYVNVVYKAKNALNQWKPLIIPIDNPLVQYQHISVKQSIAEIESFLSSKEETIICPISAELHDAFEDYKPELSSMDICAHCSKHQYKAFLEKGKRLLIDWSIDLEQKGILGEDYKFSKDEKEIARNMSITNIFNAPVNGANIVGTATNSTLNVNNTNSFDYEGVEKLLESIQKLLPVGNFIKNDLEKIQQNVDEIKESISKQDVPSVKEKLKDLADFCKGIAGNVIASGVWAQIQPFLC